MSGIKAFSSSLKHLNAPKAHPTAKVEQQFITMTPTGYDKHGLDVVLKAHYPLSASVVTIDNPQPTEDADRILFVTGHGLRKGDILRFAAGSSLEGIESEVVEIPDANTLVLGTKLPSNPVAGVDTIDVLRGVTLRTSANGTLQASSGPTEFVLDGVSQQVIKDTVTPANTIPLPVELISTSGTPATFNITAGDINVASSHDGSDNLFDSIRIGNGTNLADVNASLELLTRDGDAITALGTLLTELRLKADLTETQPVSAVSLPLPTGSATEATLEAARVLLSSIDGKDFATQTTLAAILTDLQGKADLAETQPVSAVSLPLPSGAATEASLGSLLTELQLKADLTETQPVSAVALPLPTGAATETTAATTLGVLQALDNALVSIDTDKIATQSDQLPTALGSQTSANSVSVVMASDAVPPNPKDTVVAFAQLDYSANNLATGTYTELIADIGATAGKQVIIFQSTGTPVYLAIGAAASEVDSLIIIPGGFNHPVELEIPANARLSLKSIGAAVSAGQIIINVLG